MRRQHRMSWQMTIDEPESLHLVLFVRDCYRLPVAAAGQPGPLEPAVPDLTGSLDEPGRRAAAAAWPMWWERALDHHRVASRPLPDGASTADRLRQSQRLAAVADGPEFSFLSDTPALREAARAAFGPFQQWWSPPLMADPAVRPHRAGGLGLPGVQGHLIDLHLGRSTDNDVVTAIERELGRPAEPFDLRIDILAVSQPPVILRAEHLAVISERLVADEARYRDWLSGVIRPIA
jgi:hypothetical protein